MSEWTLTRKTQALSKSGLHNLREGWFKMKVDHCKKQVASRFESREPLVKVQVKIRARNLSYDLGKRPGATLALA